MRADFLDVVFERDTFDWKIGGIYMRTYVF